MGLDEVNEEMRKKAEADAYAALFKQLHEAQKARTICMLSRDDVPRVMQSFVESGRLRILERDLDLKYNAHDETIELMGTKFSLVVLRNFKISSGEDECYCHVRDGDKVAISRTIGHRLWLQRLRHAVEEAPCTCQRIVVATDPDRKPGRCERCEILAQTPESIGAEAIALQRILQHVRVFRETTREDTNAEGWRERQLQVVGLLFGALEGLDAVLALQSREKGLIAKPGEGQ